MRKLVVTQFLTLDGVMEAPHEWSFPYWTDEIGKLKHEELFASDAQLLGRVTYNAFAEVWPGRTDADGYAHRLNNLPKYVVSTTLREATWNNSTIIGSNIADEILKLKQQPGQDILVHGSHTLVQTLLKHNLIDRFTLLVFPVVVGKGLRLFNDEAKVELKLLESKAYDTGALLQSYEPVK